MIKLEKNSQNMEKLLEIAKDVYVVESETDLNYEGLLDVLNNLEVEDLFALCIKYNLEIDSEALKENIERAIMRLKHPTRVKKVVIK